MRPSAASIRVSALLIPMLLDFLRLLIVQRRQFISRVALGSELVHRAWPRRSGPSRGGALMRHYRQGTAVNASTQNPTREIATS
jgi:hypothetical protein